MMLHYHGTPITPISVLLTLAGKCFCVPFIKDQDVGRVHQIGQSVMLDSGAYSAHRRGVAIDWNAYYAWCDRWLDCPTTWAIIRDVIDEGSQMQDAYIREWPHGQRGAPVWHMNEPIDRLLMLTENWQRVCIGSTDEFWTVLSDAWRQRMDEAWNAIARHHHRLPYIHMLRGMQLSGMEWPFASVDSTDVAQNHHRPWNTAKAMADRWDAAQCPMTWKHREPVTQHTFAM